MESAFLNHSNKRQRTPGGCFQQCWSSGDSATSNGSDPVLATPSMNPQAQPDQNEVWRILANDMTNLSINERDQVYDDIHGTGQAVEETPELLAASLKQMQMELRKIRKKPAYDLAQAAAPEYIDGDEFRLIFLRCKQFDAREAAKQLVGHLEIKRDLFGDGPLGRPIRLDDLKEDDLQAVKAGIFQILPMEDKSGRTVLFVLYPLLRLHASKSIARMYFYQCSVALEDIKTQKFGVVYMWWMHGGSFEMTRNELEATFSVAEIEKCMGIRPCGVQYCGPGKKLHPIIELAIRITGRANRIRFKFHLGSPVETLYSVASFGIPKFILPVDENNNITFAFQKQWVEQRRIIERNRSSSDGNVEPDTFLVPRATDVLFGGNSKQFYQSQGNAAFQQIIERMEPQYNDPNFPKRQKGVLCQNIIQKVKDNGGRFLLFSNGIWTICDDTAVHKRVTQAFRNRKRMKDTK